TRSISAVERTGNIWWNRDARAALDVGSDIDTRYDIYRDQSWRYPTRSAGVPDGKLLTKATPVPVTRTSIPTPGFRLISTDQSSGKAADAFRSSFSWSGRRMRNVIRMLAMLRG